jgi:2-hydroxycyclohexanecarboxyl-CoA dehydrogenase
VAVVTGGGRGIGAAIGARLAADGMAVALFDTVPGYRADRGEAFLVDVSSYEQVRTAVADILAAWGRLDIVVNNAGRDHTEAFLETDPAGWEELISTNLLGTLNVSHAAGPALRSSPAGRVLNIASEAGRVGGTDHAVYAATKGGVIAFTKALARELAPFGVTVNCVCPGLTDTPLLDEFRAVRGEEAVHAITRATPLGRLADVSDTAAAAAFLVSEEASFITGQILSVSGGLTTVG